MKRVTRLMDVVASRKDRYSKGDPAAVNRRWKRLRQQSSAQEQVGEALTLSQTMPRATTDLRVL